MFFRKEDEIRAKVAEAVPLASGPEQTQGDEGYVLLAVIVLVFLMLLALTVAAPKVAMELKHDQELETQHRANQYVRALRLYHKKTGNYPTSIEQLEKTNNQRFLRQRYIDPLTGKDDWKFIQVGQNKTTVKGFFGKDLPGLGGGLGAASGLQSNNGSSGPAGGAATGSPTSVVWLLLGFIVRLEFFWLELRIILRNGLNLREHAVSQHRWSCGFWF